MEMRQAKRPRVEAASLAESAFRLLNIRRRRAGIRRLLDLGGEVGGFVEQACCDIRVGCGLGEFQKGRRLVRQLFFSLTVLVSPLRSTPETKTRKPGFV